ncbi:hypothetical protein J2Z62_000602 [Mycoplasmoides fastidiosum]|uniref:Uncharacterized protein n=1 Tax=Mycoplasmoides fastidiosum TaxID=92758 RepID=A0ABU0LZN3_9BACT|nr:hypothetical protein [Mycoplasmoides fastidiosum]MDQ0514164.1 hypothetical protein [Mycoplasmoides fastidiosum]UUD37426.1 hypothetical protein NPA10_02505 [Mycoplasmoides fastidiosum]
MNHLYSSLDFVNLNSGHGINSLIYSKKSNNEYFYYENTDFDVLLASEENVPDVVIVNTSKCNVNTVVC